MNPRRRRALAWLAGTLVAAGSGVAFAQPAAGCRADTAGPRVLLRVTLAEAARWVRLASAAVGSRWDVETLPRDPVTSAEDESSVVLYGEFEGRGVC